MNYGGIGAVIGHELTHGFDDQGRQFDAQGNLQDWWTPADAKAFEERAQCVVDEYSSFTAVDDVKLNGKLTLGENTADNGGLRIALMALPRVADARQPAQTLDGFTPEQRFFLGCGQVWCENARPERARMLAQTNPHSPGQVPRERRRVEHAGVPEGVLVQGRRADGAPERVPGLVRHDGIGQSDASSLASRCATQIVSCERCPRLRSYCAEIARTKTARVSRRGLLGQAGARLRRSARACC